MVAFTCNLCGAQNRVEQFASEAPTCKCGSNVRVRALVHLLSMELFGQNIRLIDFPKLPGIRGVGMTDHRSYADILASKFNYTNTFYDREPRLDFTESHPGLEGAYDFILSADVLEHVAPPMERTLQEVQRLLKPTGFFVATVPCVPDDKLREHFPELHEYRIVLLGGSAVLVNRRRDGTLEMRTDLIFHGGIGSTLEMRQLTVSELHARLLGSGFRDVQFLFDDSPEIGILFDHDSSRPLIARKEPFTFDRSTQLQLMSEWRTSQKRIREERERSQKMAAQIAMASDSRWLRLGRVFGIGPSFG